MGPLAPDHILHLDFSVQSARVFRNVLNTEPTGVALASSVSSLFSAVERGDEGSSEALFCALYAELHGLAQRELARHGAGVTLGATTLLHQAYLDMAGKDAACFPDRAKFMGYAARVMRGLIVDYARNRQAQKRGGLFEITSLSEDAEHAVNEGKLIQVSEALDELAKAEPALAEVVDLRFFCGFTFAEIAAMRGISERTAQRQWEKARIYLHRSMQAELEV